MAGPGLAGVRSPLCPPLRTSLAAIGRLPDTQADRCIVIRMHRKLAREQCERLRNLDGTALTRQCVRFAVDQHDAIAAARRAIPETLHDRAADIWEPLLALADLARGAWPDKGRQAAIGLTASTQESSPIGSLLLDILLPFAKLGDERLFSRTLEGELNSLGNRPWEGRYAKARPSPNYGWRSICGLTGSGPGRSGWEQPSHRDMSERNSKRRSGGIFRSLSSSTSWPSGTSRMANGKKNEG
jgi:hypothetical protein